jgi:rSAM/selenodomain-associated transferase 1
MSKRQDAVVVVVCKAPEPGRVKTRLAREIGDDKALRVYALMMAALFANLGASSIYDVCPCVDGNINLVHAGTVDAIKQHGLTLGDRLCNAILECGDYGKKIVIGSDTPNITSDIIHQAINALGSSDVVIGPAADGGYYLIGMNKLHESIFHDISWSTDAVFSETCRRIESAGLTYDVLPVMRDIDTLEDLNAVMPELLS